MKRFAAIAVAVPLLAGLALAENFSGTLVDVMCKGKDLAGHTAKCAISCSKSGFALVTADGRFLKLDERGNSKALAALKATSKEKDLKARVAGTLDGEILKAETVELE